VPEQTDAEGPAPARTPGSATPTGEAEPAQGELPATLPEVIEALDQGRIEAAESALLEIIDQRPYSTLALRLLEQIQADPLELMGEDYDVVTVQPGDSLSGIADRELGDPLQFFALARYNGIQAPRRMSPGIELRIPRSLRRPDATDSEPAEPSADESPATLEAIDPDRPAGAGLTLAAQSLLDQGQATQAFALLSAGARAGNLDADGEQLLARAAIDRAETMAAEGRRAEALGLLDETAELMSAEPRRLLDDGRRGLQALRLEEEAIQSRRAGDLAAALSLFEEAASLDPDNQRFRAEADNVRGVLVAQLHDQALIHYRDQQLDEAILLWQRVGELAPDFESAQIYLERALALRQRLNEFD
jgi:tetratricopeptide (TPR) repeat protein